MAERRMFAKTIVLSDAFLDLPATARCLYYTLGMLADDDGFVNSPKSVMRQCGASNDDMSVLAEKKFLILFGDGVAVIKHWKINNYIRADRYVPTKYEQHKCELALDENEAYATNGIPSDNQPVATWYTEVNIGKDSIGKYKGGGNILQKNKCEQQTTTTLTTTTLRGKNGNVGLTNEQYDELKAEYCYVDKVIDALSEYKFRKGAAAIAHDFEIIKDWAEKDKGMYENYQGSFDTDDFFEAAIRRSYGNKEIGNEIHRN